jgi:hypothetical protein
MADERGRCSLARPVVALQPAGECARTRLAVGGDGATLQLLVGGVSTPLRPQCELGGAASGAGRVIAAGDSAASADRQDCGAAGDEVLGAHRPRQRRGLRTNGRDLGQASLRHAASGTALQSLARGLARDTRAHSENATASGRGDSVGRTGPGAGSGNGSGALTTSESKAQRRSARDGCTATGTNTASHRARPPRTQPSGGAIREGANETC